MFGEKLLLMLHIESLLFLILLLLNFKDIRKQFIKIKTCIWALLFLLIIFAIIVPLEHNALGQRKMEEWVYQFTVARDFSLGKIHFFVKESTYAPLYAYLVSMLFSTFGINFLFVYFLDYMFIGFVTLGMFLLTYSLFKKEKLALFASFMYVFITHYAISIYYEREFVDIIHFFVVYSILFFILSYKVNTKKMYLLSLVTLIFVGLAKLEVILIGFLFPVGLIFFRKNDFSSFRRSYIFLKSKLFVPTILFLFFSYPYILSFNYTISHENISPYVSQQILNMLKPTGILSANTLRIALNMALEFWSSLIFFYLTIFVFIGILFSLKSRKKEITYLLLLFLISNIPYVLSPVGYTRKYGLNVILPIIVISSFGIYSVYSIVIYQIIKILKSKILRRGMIVISLVIMLYLFGGLYLDIFRQLERTKEAHHYILYYNQVLPILNIIHQDSNSSRTKVFVPMLEEVEITEFLSLGKVQPIDTLIRDSEIFYQHAIEYAKKYPDLKPEYIWYGPGVFILDTKIEEKSIRLHKEVMNLTSHEIYNKYKNVDLSQENDPLNLTLIDGSNYFIRYPSCEYGYFDVTCKIIEENYNLTTIYEKEEITVNGRKGKLRVYRINM